MKSCKICIHEGGDGVPCKNCLRGVDMKDYFKDNWVAKYTAVCSACGYGPYASMKPAEKIVKCPQCQTRGKMIDAGSLKDADGAGGDGESNLR